MSGHGPTRSRRRGEGRGRGPARPRCRSPCCPCWAKFAGDIRGKGYLHDPGMHVPFICYDPHSSDRGMVREDLVTATDITATILELAGIEWAANGSNDTITVVAFADGDTITEAAFNAATKSMLTADFDQSTFDTLNIGNQRFYVDEIRIATTFDDAVTATAVPEPRSLALVGLGALALLARRRRRP